MGNYGVPSTVNGCIYLPYYKDNNKVEFWLLVGVDSSDWDCVLTINESDFPGEAKTPIHINLEATDNNLAYDMEYLLNNITEINITHNDQVTILFSGDTDYIDYLPSLERLNVQADRIELSGRRRQEDLSWYPPALNLHLQGWSENTSFLNINSGVFQFCQFENVFIGDFSQVNIRKSAFLSTFGNILELNNIFVFMQPTQDKGFTGTWNELIMQNMEYVPNYCFENATISNIYLGEGITRIGLRAFYMTDLPTSVTLPETVTYIGEKAFSGSTINSISLPANSLEIIGPRAFFGCENLYQPNGYAIIDHWLVRTNAFPDTFRYLTIGLDVWGVEESFDDGMQSEYVLEIARSYLTLSTDHPPFSMARTVICPTDEFARYAVFHRATSIILKDGMISLGTEEIDLVNTQVQNLAFEYEQQCSLPKLKNASSLTSIVFKNMNLNTSELSFSNLFANDETFERLNKISFSSSNYTENAFSTNQVLPIKQLFFSRAQEEEWYPTVYEGMFSHFPELILISDSTGTLVSQSSCICNGDTVYGTLKNDQVLNTKTFNIPENITRIGEKALINLPKERLAKVTLPSTLKEIGKDAFLISDFTPDGEDAGVYINSINTWLNISFEGSSSNPLYVFRNLWVDNKKLDKLDIPSDNLEIRQYQFFNCHTLNTINVPESGATFGYRAFENAINLSELHAFGPLTLDQYALSLTNTTMAAEPEAQSGESNQTQLNIFLHPGAKIVGTASENISRNAFEGRTSTTLSFHKMAEGDNYYLTGDIDYFLINTHNPDGTITQRNLNITFHDLNDEKVVWDTHTGIVTATNRRGEKRAVRTSGVTCFTLKPNEELVVEGKVIRPYWYY